MGAVDGMRSGARMDEHIRASDADRDSSARVLATALSEGRLDLEEYDQRLSAAMRAGTIGELVPLTADLPVAEPRPTAEPVAAEAPPSTKGALSKELRSWMGGGVIMIGIWGVTSVMATEPLPFWPLIPIGIWLAVLIAGIISPDRKHGCGRG